MVQELCDNILNDSVLAGLGQQMHKQATLETARSDAKQHVCKHVAGIRSFVGTPGFVPNITQTVLDDVRALVDDACPPHIVSDVVGKYDDQLASATVVHPIQKYLLESNVGQLLLARTKNTMATRKK